MLGSSGRANRAKMLICNFVRVLARHIARPPYLIEHLFICGPGGSDFFLRNIEFLATIFLYALCKLDFHLISYRFSLAEVLTVCSLFHNSYEPVGCFLDYRAFVAYATLRAWLLLFDLAGFDDDLVLQKYTQESSIT